jgi:AraC-like DNA-binding protein
MTHHHGISMAAYSVAGFRVFEVLYPAGTFVRGHTHAAPGLTSVVHGALVERGTRSDVLQPGEAILQPARRHHENRFPDSDTTCLVLEIPQRRWRCLEGLLPRPAESALVGPPELDRLQRRVLTRLHHDSGPSAYLLEASLLELLGCVDGALRRRREAALVREAGARLEDDCTSSAEDVALALGTSAAELDRAFREHAGVSLLRFRLEKRGERARQLLLETSLPLARIALETGFFDQAHMTHAFRRLFGTSPGRYRRRRGE